ncbi:MAG: hypothetical protein K2M12_07745 [Muribaculaceae bacterium]|nr:hypothetical protein [Muribaculaceae bacterium]
MKDNSIISGTLKALFYSYAVTVGLLVVLLGVSFYISKTLFPAVVLVTAFLLSAIMRSWPSESRQQCNRMAWTVEATLVVSALVMMVLLLSHVKALFGDRFNTRYFNPDMPYITCLVVQTIGALVSLYALFMGRSLGVCRRCREKFGEYDNNSMASMLFNDESAQQLRMFFWICFGMGVVQWTYFFVFFINVNFNSPDLFMFCYLPVAVYLFSLLYLAMRYYSIAEAFKATKSGATKVNRGTQLRFIVTGGDRMLLRENGNEEYDTPYRAEVSLVKPDDAKARERFEAMGGPAGTPMRFLYENFNTGGERTMHYAAFVEENECAKASKGGNWFTLYEVDRFLNTGRLAPMMANEIVRIYTVTMAWKTYDRQGHRLYPIKHYKPIFRLRDFKDWDVDYNDPAWVQVSMENEDQPFFRARRLWRKCLNIFSRR